MLRSFAGRFFLALLPSVLLPGDAICAQTADSRFSAASLEHSCRGNFRAQLAESDRSWHLRATVRDAFQDACETPLDPPGSAPAAVAPPQTPWIRQPVDPVLQQLSSLGAAGWTIAVAREEVLDILEDSNSCSAWYAAAEPNPARKFASLFFRVDPSGALSVVTRYDGATGLIYLEPYVARAQQSVGAGSTITVNANGAFFVSRAPLRLSSLVSTASPGGHRLLRVGDFEGGSLRAQVATLLHEFAHIVGLIPVDAGQARSPQLSTQNTEAVLGWCRKQIEASASHSVILPASFAALERPAKNHRSGAVF